MDRDFQMGLAVPRAPPWVILTHGFLLCTLHCRPVLNDPPKFVAALSMAWPSMANSMSRTVNGIPASGSVPVWPYRSLSATPRRRHNGVMVLTIGRARPNSELRDTWGICTCVLRCRVKFWTYPTEPAPAHPLPRTTIPLNPLCAADCQSVQKPAALLL